MGGWISRSQLGVGLRLLRVHLVCELPVKGGISVRDNGCFRLVQRPDHTKREGRVVLVIEVVVEFKVETFDIFEGRNYLFGDKTCLKFFLVYQWRYGYSPVAGNDPIKIF